MVDELEGNCHKSFKSKAVSGCWAFRQVRWWREVWFLFRINAFRWGALQNGTRNRSKVLGVVGGWDRRTKLLEVKKPTKQPSGQCTAQGHKWFAILGLLGLRTLLLRDGYLLQWEVMAQLTHRCIPPNHQAEPEWRLSTTLCFPVGGPMMSICLFHFSDRWTAGLKNSTAVTVSRILTDQNNKFFGKVLVAMMLCPRGTFLPSFVYYTCLKLNFVNIGYRPENLLQTLAGAKYPCRKHLIAKRWTHNRENPRTLHFKFQLQMPLW